MANPLLALLDPRKAQSATTFDENGNPVPQDNWSTDASADPNLAPSPTPALPAEPVADASKGPSLGGDRNAATVDVLAKALGVPTGYGTEHGPLQGPVGGMQGPASGIVGFNSQQSLEDASQAQADDKRKDQQANFDQAQAQAKTKNDADLLQFFSPGETNVRNEQERAKMDLALAPVKQAGVNALGEQTLKNQGLLGVATVNAAAKTHAADAASMAKANALPQQIQVQAIQAGTVADKLEDLDKELDDPQLSPYIGALGGRISEFIQGKIGAGDLGITDPQTLQKIGKLQSDLAFAVSGVARAHNQRGATKELIEQFENQLSQARDPNLLHGAIGSAKSWMLDYANPHVAPPGLAVGAPAPQVPAAPADSLAHALGVKPKPIRYDFNGNIVP